MRDISKSIELYQLIIDRLKCSGNAPNQLKAYEASLELIKNYQTAEEAMEALAASPLYTAVARALALDDLCAKRKAAAEQGMQDVVAVYDAKIAEVRQDYLKAWDTAYVTEIQMLSAAHARQKEQEIQDRINALESEIKRMEDTDPDISEDWAAICRQKSEITAIGEKELQKVRRASAVASAPSDRFGKYSFECSAREVF